VQQKCIYHGLAEMKKNGFQWFFFSYSYPSYFALSEMIKMTGFMTIRVQWHYSSSSDYYT